MSINVDIIKAINVMSFEVFMSVTNEEYFWVVKLYNWAEM
jgi:hypothetical protein